MSEGRGEAGRLRLITFAAWIAIVPACGSGGTHSNGSGGSGGGGDGGADGGSLTDAAADGAGVSAENARRLESCGVKGEYLISQATPDATCDGAPHAGDTIVVELGPDGAPRVRVGAYTMPVDVSADCVVSADSCTTTTDPDTTLETYSRVTLRLTRLAGGSGVEAVFDGTAVENHRAQTCEGHTTLTAAPRRACEPLGRYTAATAASVTSGQCTYGWPAGDITIEAAPSDRYRVSWAGETFDPAPLDAAGCSLTATKGVGNNLFIYNGAPRAVRLTLNVTAAGIEGSVDDQLTGTSDNGETCAATFHFSAGRAVAGGTALPRGCALPPPFICGDGMCDDAHGEGCYACLEDCSCAGSLRCAVATTDDPGRCLQPCSVWADQCPDGQRCDYLPGATFLSSSTQAYCGPAGTVTSGSRCLADADCVRGLECLREINWPDSGGLCLPRCNRDRTVSGAPACASPSTCIDDPRSTTAYLGGCAPSCDPKVANSCPGTGAVCWMPYTNVAGHCAAQPPGGLSDVGGPCPDPAKLDLRPGCKPGLECVGFNCTISACAISVCTVPCTTSATCPPALPACRIDSCGPAM